MFRVIISVLALHFLLAGPASAQTNPLKAMWPFGKKQKTIKPISHQDRDSINPFSTGNNRSTPSKSFGLPSPSKWINKAEKTTDSFFKKTPL